MITILLCGWAMGFAGSMPLAGPAAILVFGRGLEGRTKSGLALACGTALAESGYALLAWLGLTELSLRFSFLAPLSRGLAAGILLALGIAFLLRPFPKQKPLPARERPGSSFLLGLSITACNPTFLATWGAAVTVLQSTSLVPITRGGAWPFAFGVAGGVVSWFALMLEVMRRHKERLSSGLVHRAVQGLGAALVVMGVVAGANLAVHLVR